MAVFVDMDNSGLMLEELQQVARAKRSKLQNLRTLQELAMEKLASRGTICKTEYLKHPRTCKFTIEDPPVVKPSLKRVNSSTPQGPCEKRKFENQGRPLSSSISRLRFEFEPGYFISCPFEPLSKEDVGETILLPQVSPLLQKEILDHILAYLGSSRIMQKPDSVLWMITLFEQVLLNERTKEFDFVILTDYYPVYHKKVWEILVKKCPNIERITFCRSIYDDRVEMETVLPHLKTFKKLEHINLATYICSSNDLTEISQHFPNLRTLSTQFDFANAEILKTLQTLQKLERLSIKWNKIWRWYKEEDEEERHLCSLDHFNAECLAHLPNLQYLSGGAENHNNRPIPGNRQLSLREMVVDGVFDFNLVPCLEKLTISRSDHLDFGFLSNLRSLNFNGGVASEGIYEVLSACGDKLEELQINDKTIDLDIYKLIAKCPNLRKFAVECNWSNENSTYFLTDKHFECITSFSLHVLYNWNFQISPGAALMSLVLAAPNLEEISISANCIFSFPGLPDLTEELVEGRILQKLKKFQLREPGKITQLNPMHKRFLCLLPVYAPRLEEMKIQTTHVLLLDKLHISVQGFALKYISPDLLESIIAFNNAM